MNRTRAAAAALAAVAVLGGVVAASGALGVAVPGLDGPSATPTEAVERTELAPTARNLTAAEGQVIRGRTPLAPGTELTIRVTSTSSGTPFLRSVGAVVDDDGTFDGTVDLSPAAAGSDVRVLVLHDGEELVNTTVAVGAPDGGGGSGDGSDSTGENDSGTGTSVEFDGDAVTLGSATGQVVVGTTGRQPGTELQVQLRSSGGPSPFVERATTTVRDDGTFRATFDLSDAAPGTEFTVVVLHDGEHLAEAPGEVVEDR